MITLLLVTMLYTPPTPALSGILDPYKCSCTIDGECTCPDVNPYEGGSDGQ